MRLFVVRLYVEAWINAPNAEEAPKRDLLFFKNLYENRKSDWGVSGTALRKFRNYLWYLSPEAVTLGFFDEKVPVETKKRMVEAFESDITDNADKLRKRISVSRMIMSNSLARDSRILFLDTRKIFSKDFIFQ